MELIFCTGSYALRYMQMRTVHDRHVYLHGSSNCGKSFILSPLKVIFQYITLIAWADLWQALERDAV